MELIMIKRTMIKHLTSFLLGGLIGAFFALAFLLIYGF